MVAALDVREGIRGTVIGPDDLGYDMTVAVRGGGHSVLGFDTCDGGVVVDMSSAMRDVRVDPLTHTARPTAPAFW